MHVRYSRRVMQDAGVAKADADGGEKHVFQREKTCFGRFCLPSALPENKKNVLQLFSLISKTRLGVSLRCFGKTCFSLPCAFGLTDGHFDGAPRLAGTSVCSDAEHLWGLSSQDGLSCMPRTRDTSNTYD